MGGRAGGAGGFISGIGSRRTYGMNKYQRIAFEAMKGDLQHSGDTFRDSKGRLFFIVDGKTFTESGLAEYLKQGWKNFSDGTVRGDRNFAKRLTLNMINIKTGEWFDTRIIK